MKNLKQIVYLFDVKVGDFIYLGDQMNTIIQLGPPKPFEYGREPISAFYHLYNEPEDRVSTYYLPYWDDEFYRQTK